MIKANIAGQLSFQDLHDVTFDGQDYGGDSQYTAFTTDHIRNLLSDVAFRDLIANTEDRTICRKFGIRGFRGK